MVFGTFIIKTWSHVLWNGMSFQQIQTLLVKKNPINLHKGKLKWNKYWFLSKTDWHFDIEISSGRRSRVSRRQIVEATWIFDSDDNDSSESSNGNGNDNDEPEIKPELIDTEKPAITFDPHCDNFSTNNTNEQQQPLVPVLFGNLNNFCRSVDGTDSKDNLDSYMSTRTDDTETNTYTFADSDHFDSVSVASTAYDDSRFYLFISFSFKWYMIF